MKPENFMLAAAGVALVVALCLTGQTKEAPPAPPTPTPGANVRYQPFVFLDDVTGCQYLSTHSSAALTPRIAADGKAHMGCKAVTP
jgi:hypothetical protein